MVSKILLPALLILMHESIYKRLDNKTRTSRATFDNLQFKVKSSTDVRLPVVDEVEHFDQKDE